MSALPTLWKPILGTGAVLALMIVVFALGLTTIGLSVGLPQDHRSLTGSFGAPRVADYGAGPATRFAPVTAEIR